MKRIIVIGSSCSGKSTFARQLAQQLNIKHIELDQLHWLPNWQERSDNEFRHLITKAIQEDSWVVDGNYAVSRDITWPKATTIIWLNHSFSRVFYRAISRSIIRAATKETLFSGNIETFKQTFFSRNSIIFWVLKTYHQKRKNYAKLLSQLESPSTKVIQFTNQKQVDCYLKKVTR